MSSVNKWANIYKYPLENGPGIVMPVGAQILKVGTQKDKYYLWALVPEGAPSEIRKFEIRETGSVLNLHGSWKYIDTIFSHETTLVWHVFEVLPR